MISTSSHGSILRAKSEKAIDLIQLGKIEQAFRAWVGATPGEKRQLSRLRVLLVFLIIRYTGARLNEVLSNSSVVSGVLTVTVAARGAL